VQWVRPDDAALIVILLDGRGDDARHTNAITAMSICTRHRLIEHRGVHRGAVLASELKDVADLDAAHDLECAVPGGTRIAGHHIAQIGAAVRAGPGPSSRRCSACLFVGAQTKSATASGVIGNYAHASSPRADITGLAPQAADTSAALARRSGAATLRYAAP